MNTSKFALISIATLILTAFIGSFFSGNGGVLVGLIMGSIYCYFIMIPFLKRYL